MVIIKIVRGDDGRPQLRSQLSPGETLEVLNEVTEAARIGFVTARVLEKLDRDGARELPKLSAVAVVDDHDPEMER